MCFFFLKVMCVDVKFCGNFQPLISICFIYFFYQTSNCVFIESTCRMSVSAIVVNIIDSFLCFIFLVWCTCGDDEFKCNLGNVECISNSSRFNRIPDCQDGSDEGRAQLISLWSPIVPLSCAFEFSLNYQQHIVDRSGNYFVPFSLC